MNSHEPLEELVATLRRQTEAGTIDWRRSDDPDSFLYRAPSGTIIVTSIPGNGRPPFEIQLLDDVGGTVEHYESSAQTGEDVIAMELFHLFEAIGRQRKPADITIENLLRDLKARAV